jgi:hypothetical protein
VDWAAYGPEEGQGSLYAFALEKKLHFQRYRSQKKPSPGKHLTFDNIQ